MLFDPFIYHGMAEMHDRHRDMRLDVDNMSYEVKLEQVFSHKFCFNTVPITMLLDNRNCWHWRNV